MASLPNISTSRATTFSLSSFTCPFPNPNPSNGRRNPTAVRPISCTHSNIDRRNVLIGLGGLYGATAAPKLTSAAPIAAPDIANCGAAHGLPDGDDPTECCPPKVASQKKVVDFVLPSSSSPLRVRPAAHLVDLAYVAKFERAVSLMRELPEDDPRSFSNMANVHCAYCEGAYRQAGFPNLDIDIHRSWLFFPWHRCHLYFFERILGKMVGDESFAIPFWNWDAPDGMSIPAMYTNRWSSLFDARRDGKHQPPALVDLGFNGYDNPQNDPIQENLTTMYRQMISGAPSTQLFFGNPYRAGGTPGGAGTVENVPHGTIHDWTGDRCEGEEDMGQLYSAARDPIFYAHHSNIDRLWIVWKTLEGTRRVDPTDSDFLDTAFIFYDENAQPVRIKVRDVLDPAKLRYSYQPVPTLWVHARPVRRSLTSSQPEAAKVEATTKDPVKFPLTLGSSAVNVAVERLSKKERAKGDEVLVVEDIEFARDKYVKFDVFVNAPEHYHEVSAAGTEFAGSFVNVAHKHTHDKKEKTRLQLCIDELLEDLGAKEDESIVVTLVPRKGKVKIGGVKMEAIS